MRPEQFARLRELLLQAAELGSRDRLAFLDKVCAGDPGMRDEIESLLVHDDRDWAALDALEWDYLAPPADQILEATPHIAGFRINHKLGEGGMGEVFLAEQIIPLQRDVALKIIKAGMDTREVLDRFEAERQTLAILNHPNIANIFHAGTTETGRPYFVMELVEGLSITDHCGSNNLCIRDRLELFIPVCFAIHHAHTKGIIHRDIKPSNVLVTIVDGRAVPKVIDFGVAKAIDNNPPGRAFLTRQGQIIGTPEYMSPEQADMRDSDINASTDIYSLGVLLYELLTGTLPFSSRLLLESGFQGMRRIICEVAPPLPSSRVSRRQDVCGQDGEHPAKQTALSKTLLGDLDWIVLKAMAKDPAQRYASAADLGADLRRHLDGEPILARRPRFSARARALFRPRFRVPVVIITILALLGGAAAFLKLDARSGIRGQGDMVAVEVFQGRNLRAIGSTGNVLWARNFKDRIWPNGRWNTENRPPTILTRNGRPVGVVISLWPDTGPGSLLFLGAEDGEDFWSREAAWGVEPINANGPLFYDWTAPVSWPGENDGVLAAGLLDGDYYAFCLQFLTFGNDHLGSYYHPGPLTYCDRIDLGGPAPSILLFGANSSARFVRELVPFEAAVHPGCVVLLDPSQVEGQAYPYSEGLPEHRDWPGMVRARERSYLLIPPILPSQSSGVTGLKVDLDPLYGFTIQANVQDGRFITLDSDLIPISVFLGLGTPADSLFKAGSGDFLPCLLIREGKMEFVTPPIISD